MPISLTCPQCNGKLRVADHLVGKNIKCPKCSALLPVAAPEEGAITKEKPSAKTEGITQTITTLEEVEDDDEEEEAPRSRKRTRSIRRDPAGNAVSTIIPYKNVRALVVYYLGVLGLIPCALSCFVLLLILFWKHYLPEFRLIPCVGLLLGPAALVLGILGLRFVRANPTAKGTGHAFAGIILGGLTTVVNLGVLIVLFAMGKPA